MSRRGSEAVARLVDSDSSDVQFGSFRKLAHFINNFNFFTISDKSHKQLRHNHLYSTRLHL